MRNVQWIISSLGDNVDADEANVISCPEPILMGPLLRNSWRQTLKHPRTIP